jgi:predicted ATPase
LIALFGAPDVHEDDPLRAVRAAIEVRQALHEAYAALTAQCDYEQETSEQAAASSLFAPRLGLSTGTAFVGAVGDKRRREFLVLGAVVQQALEAAAAADPNEILLTAETRRLVERHVVLHDTLPSDYTPDSKPFAVVECLAAPKQDAHFNVTACPPFIGREVELDKLLDSAAAARQAKGQVVALVGEAGSGKTRLIEEMHERLLQPSGEEAKSFQVVRVECQRYEQHIPYAVARELLRQLLGLAPESSAATFAAAVSKRLQHGDSELVRFLPVLGNLLGYPVAETPLSNSLTAEQRHQRAYDLIEELVWIAARQQPLALVIDNVHWADASSFVLVDWLAQAASGLPLLLVLSYRPNTLSAEPWRSAGLILSLGDLWREQSTLLAASILGAMPSNTLMAVLEQAQGNPLFITELIWRLTQQGMLEKGSAGWELRTPPASVTLPARIEQVIAARLERLESVDRAVLQAAAVIGHRFSRSLLADVVADAALLSQRLENLQCNGFIRQAAFGYTFCNSLLRDIAYESILPEQRRDLHRRIAICLAKMHDNATDGQLELLARHSLLAEDWSSTFGYHLAAGRQARTRQATHEAITLFEAALATAPRLAAPPYDELLELHERLGYTRMLRGQYKKALEHFEQALTLCKHERSNATTETLMRLHRHIARIHERRADYAAAFEWLEQALALSSDTPNHESTCCLLLGAEIYQRQGKYNQSLVWAKCGLQMAETTENMRDQAYAYKLLANAHNDLGDIARAIDLAEKSLDFYTKVQDYQGQADLHNNLGVFLYTIGQWAKARLHYESAASLTAAIGDVYQQAVVANNLGDALRSLGDLDGAIVQYRLAQQGLQSSLYGSGVVALNLGAIYIRYGELDLAAKQFDHSFALLEQAEAEGPLSELFCYRAELALIQGDHAAALEHVQTALNYAVQLGTQLAEGISRRMFGRVFAAQGNLASAEKELQASIALLHEIGSRYELARSLLVFADLAPRFDQYKQGRAALAQAQETFNTLGAQLDLEHAQQVAARWGYQAAPYNNGKVVQPA